MGLRDYLATLGMAEQSTAQFADTAEKMRKAAAEQAFVQQAPELIRQGKLPEAAAMAVGYGNNAPMNELIQGEMRAKVEAAKPGKKEEIFDASLVPSYAKAYGVDQSVLIPMVGRKIQDVEKVAGAAQHGKEFGITFNRLTEQFDTKTNQWTETKLQDVSKIIGKTNKDITDSTSKVESALKNFDQKATPAAGNILIRAIVTSTGDTRLSDQDIAGLKLTGLPNKAEELYNYLNGAQAETLTVQQKSELIRLAKAQLDNAQVRKSRIIASQAKDLFSLNPSLVFDNNNNPRPQVKKLMEDNGLKIQGDKNGFEIIVGVKEGPASAMNPETGTVDINKLDQIINLMPDGPTKTAAKAKMDIVKKKSASGNPINGEQLKEFYSRIKSFIPTN